MINILDSAFKRIISVLFRLLLVINSVIIILTFDNIFPNEYYVIGGVFYIILYFLLRNKKGFFSILRLLSDYLFILLILWNKPTNNILTLTLILLPIVNSVNHSTNENRSRFSFLLVLLSISLLYVLNKFSFSFAYLVPILSFSLINSLIYFRTSMIRQVTQLHNTIDQFYEENFSVFGINNILKNITRIISKDKTLLQWFLKPELIVAFRLNEKKLTLRSSSNFIISFEFNDEVKFLHDIMTSGVCEDFEISVDGKKLYQTLAILITSGADFNYVYVITCKSKLFGVLYTKHLLKPLFTKVSRVLEIEVELKMERSRYLDNIKSKMQFVSSTIQAVHFLNNKFTPITGYFSLCKRLSTLEDGDTKNQLQEIINQERIKADENLDLVLNKFNEIRDRSLNPYLVQGLHKFSLFKIFSIIRQAWEENGLDRNAFEIQWTPEVFKKVIEINLDSFEYVLEEIIINIIKHSTCDYSLRFLDYDGQPTAKFTNKIKSYKKNEATLKRNIKDFNNEKTGETIKRTSYGLSFIKQFLEQLKIQHNIELTDGNFVLTLKFNPANDETSDF